MNDLTYLGDDILLDDDFDISLTNGDMNKVSYGKCVAQDLRKAIYKKVFHYLNNDEISTDEIKNIIKQQCEIDPRVDLESIVVNCIYQNEDIVFSVDFIPLGLNTKENIIIGV